jgi:hypothetical protein
MSLSDYLIDIALIAIVFRQIRESSLDARAVILPIALAVFVGGSYLTSLPTGGNDLALIVGLTLVGVTFGAVSGMTTRVRHLGGRYPKVKAGWIAAGVWVAGMGFRFGFAVWASHGGAQALGRFSAHHHITSGAAWTDALVLMALGEVFVRTAVLVVRGRRAVRDAQPAPQLLTV